MSLSGGGALWGLGPTGADLVELVRRRGGLADPHLRQRVAALHIHEEILRLIRLRTVQRGHPRRGAGARGVDPQGAGRRARPGRDGPGPRPVRHRRRWSTDGGPMGDDPGMWHYGWLFSQALTIGGGTGDVQRNIVAERVLGLPHDLDVEVGQTWAEARRRPSGRPPRPA